MSIESDYKINLLPKPNIKIIPPWSKDDFNFAFNFYGKFPNFWWRLWCYIFFGVKFERIK